MLRPCSSSRSASCRGGRPLCAHRGQEYEGIIRVEPLNLCATAVIVDHIESSLFEENIAKSNSALVGNVIAGDERVYTGASVLERGERVPVTTVAGN